MRPALLLLLAAPAAAAAWEPHAPRRSAGLTVVQRGDTGGGVVVADAVLDGAVVATAQFNNSINATGWATLRVSANASFGDEQMAYAAGYVEGSTTWESIQLFVLNSGSNFTWSSKLADFLEANERFMRGSVGSNPADPYWHGVSLLLEQLAGLYWGYADAAAPHGVVPYPFRAIMNVQLSGDLEDLAAALALQTDPATTLLPAHPRDEARGIASRRRRVSPTGRITGGDSGHCSALVKLLPGNAELFFSQVTWSAFETMIRIFKRYDLPFSVTGDKSSGVVAAVSMTLSSYPASLFSGDDYYTMSSGLAMLETTIGNNNATLYQLYVKPTTVLEWMRNLLANRMAASGAEWVAIYRQYNSGSYNNENFIVDYNRFTPGQPLPDGVLWVADQVPGLIVAADLTYQLRETTYLPSYNSPIFPAVFNISGDVDEACGAWCTCE